MAEARIGRELDLCFYDSANGPQNDNKGNVSPREDYNPLEDCT